MNFHDFCVAHGLVVENVIYGRWIRVKTIDKPNHRNGAYFHGHTYAVVQNHATMVDCAIWKNDDPTIVPQSPKEKARIKDDLLERQTAASKKAAWIMHQCTYQKHAYLDAKGFSDENGLVWQKSDTENLLCIPMRVNSNLVGVQMIDRVGQKRFLFGQRCSDAEYVIGAKGQNYYCEGYCTGLSLRAALKALKIPHTIHVCFSAGNLLKVALRNKHGIVIADHDESGTGERIACQTGLPYWMSPVLGEDFNDFHQRAGILSSAMAIKKLVYAAQ